MPRTTTLALHPLIQSAPSTVCTLWDGTMFCRDPAASRLQHGSQRLAAGLGKGSHVWGGNNYFAHTMLAPPPPLTTLIISRILKQMKKKKKRGRGRDRRNLKE